MKKVNLRDMSHAELLDRLTKKTVILIPLGSQEVQGPHAPMGDYALAERLAELSAEKGDALCAPVVPFGYADFFRSFAGGIQLRAQTLAMVLEDVLSGFMDHGLDRLLVFNGHTTNLSVIDQVTRKLRAERGIVVPTLNIWKAIPDKLWTELYGDQASAVRGHGGEPITSVAAHLFPELMRFDLVREKEACGQIMGLPATSISGTKFNGQPLHLPLDARDVDANGLLGGSAVHASAEKCAALCDHIIDHTAQLIAHLMEHSPRVPGFPFRQRTEHSNE
jgi:creatinine amidohydrolase